MKDTPESYDAHLTEYQKKAYIKNKGEQHNIEPTAATHHLTPYQKKGSFASGYERTFLLPYQSTRAEAISFVM